MQSVEKTYPSRRRSSSVDSEMALLSPASSQPSLFSNVHPVPDPNDSGHTDGDQHLRIRSLRKVYQSSFALCSSGSSVVAVDDLSLDICRGEVLALLGSNVCNALYLCRFVYIALNMLLI